MIHPSQLRITVPSRQKGGQHVGLSLPTVTVEHIASGCVVTVKDGRSVSECKRLAEEALEYVLLGLRWHSVDLEMDVSENLPKERKSELTAG